MRVNESDTRVLYRTTDVREDESSISSKLKGVGNPGLMEGLLAAFYTIILMVMAGIVVFWGFENSIPILALIPSIAIVLIIVSRILYVDTNTKMVYGLGIVSAIFLGVISFVIGFSYKKSVLSWKELLIWLEALFIFAGVCSIIGSILFCVLYNKSCSESVMGVVKGYLDTIASDRFKGKEVKTAVVCEFSSDNIKYLVSDYRFVSNDSDLPYIGRNVEISYNPDDPYTCIIDEQPKKPVMGLLIGGALLTLSLALFVLSAERSKITSGNGKTVLSPEYIHEYFNRDEDYFVIEREVKEVVNGYLYFDEYAGTRTYIKDYIGNSEPGDMVYYVCTANFYCSVFSTDKYECEDMGDIKFYVDYTDDGKFILDDYMISQSMYTDYWNIDKVAVLRLEKDAVVFKTSDGREFWMSYTEGYDHIVEGFNVGDEFYYVQTYTDDVVAFDTDYYYRKDLETAD